MQFLRYFIYYLEWEIAQRDVNWRGRRRSSGKESDYVSVRAPKNKRKEYREDIKEFVENKFVTEPSTITEESSIVKLDKNNLARFRNFEEFVEDLKKTDEEGRDWDGEISIFRDARILNVLAVFLQICKYQC